MNNDVAVKEAEARQWLWAMAEIDRLRAENERLAQQMYEECVPQGEANERIAKEQEWWRGEYERLLEAGEGLERAMVNDESWGDALARWHEASSGAGDRLGQRAAPDSKGSDEVS